MIIKSEYAKYLPAINDTYIEAISRNSISSLRLSDQRLPTRYPSISGLNFFTPTNKKWNYNAVLLSKGVVSKNIAADNKIYRRDKNKVFLFGDSGGYQLAKGKFSISYNDKKGRERVFNEILQWEENYCNAAVLLDDPPWAKVKPFAQCLRNTELAVDYWVANKSGAVPMLNVLHGSTEEEIDLWYDAVKRSNQFQGWAFGGPVSQQIYFMLYGIIKLWENNELQDAEQIHLFGTSASFAAIIATKIQQVLRSLKGVNPNIQITFDSSNPTQEMSVYSWLTGIREAKSGNAPLVTEVFELSDLSIPKGSNCVLPEPFNNIPFHGALCSNASPFLKGLKLNEMIVERIAAGDLGFDMLSTAIITVNNTYWHVEMVKQSNELAGLYAYLPEEGRKKLSKQWQKVLRINDCISKMFAKDAKYAYQQLRFYNSIF